jgi:hypothetical protein
VIVYTRYDLVVLAIAVIGAFLFAKKQPTAAGLTWILAALVKPWSLVLVPGLAGRRDFRAFLVAVAAGACSLAAWLVWAGPNGPRQVLTYRNARGWEAQSVPGSLLRVFTRDPVRMEAGSWRLGAPPTAFAVLLGLCIAVSVTGVSWYRAHRTVTEGVPELVALAATLSFVTLLSPQFIIWILPWVAIAAGAGAVRIERWAGVVVALTFLTWALFDVNHAGKLTTELAVLARNGSLLGLLLVAATELRRGAPIPNAHETTIIDSATSEEGTT